ncbi:uncharacterized protein LOC128668259, partial [Microplitis demolitor]|uniref:uncharacterized protein LOC128668259 n=1 Tax=Microplitis demolitor TaxID=69319 RepID=UPI00235B626F
RSSVDDGQLLAQHRFAAINKQQLTSPGRYSLPRKKPIPTDFGRDTFGPPGSFSPTAHIQRGVSSFTRNNISPLQHYSYQRGDGCHSQQDDPANFEYFVPRSISEFNLSASSVQDIAIAPVPLPNSVLKPCSNIATCTSSQTKTTGTNVQSNNSCLGRPSTESTSGTASAILGTRSREKMVTFEDEGCPGSTPTRKNLPPTMENVFM